MDLIHDRYAKRFRLPLDGGAGEAYIAYAERDSNTLDLQHTVVPPEARGQGAGSRIVGAALDHARAHGLRVVPSCPFVGEYLRDHPEYGDVVA